MTAKRRVIRRPKRPNAEVMAEAYRRGLICICPRCVALCPERAALAKQVRGEMKRRFSTIRPERDL